VLNSLGILAGVLNRGISAGSYGVSTRLVAVPFKGLSRRAARQLIWRFNLLRLRDGLATVAGFYQGTEGMMTSIGR
jgi:hypothetical protein